MREYKVGDVVTIREDLTEEECVEILCEVFGRDGDIKHYVWYYRDIISKTAGKRFSITESDPTWYAELKEPNNHAYQINWFASNAIAPKLFKESVSRQLEIDFGDD